MSILKDGKFNPACVEHKGASIDLVAPDGGKWSLGQCAMSNAEALRSWMRETLESALCRKLDDYVEPEYQYALGGFNAGYSGMLIRYSGDSLAVWCSVKKCWNKSRMGPLVVESKCAPLTTEQVEKLFGRAALGLPVEAPLR